MYWKTYKALAPKDKRDETYYVVGIDIGNETSGLAFYNLHENIPETIDISGGYGKPSVPTVVQYIAETKEWVFGEYAVLNQGVGTEVTLQYLVKKLGQFDYVEIDNKPVSIMTILSLFIKELLSSIRNINPKAEIAGIVAAIPAYLGAAGQEELRRAFCAAGYEKELIALVAGRECVLAHHYSGHHVNDAKILLLDYGNREVRGGLYHIQENSETYTAKAVSSLFDESIGIQAIWEDVYNFFRSQYYAIKQQEPAPDQLTAFIYQHRDMLFKKNIRTKPAKLYFNFVYPPFQKDVSYHDSDRLVKPYRQQFLHFLRDLFSKNIHGEATAPGDVDTVLCTGGGFEMLWVREAVTEVVGSGRSRTYKNSKMVVAEGAALIAAQLLGVAAGKRIVVEDTHQLTIDIGLVAGNAFIPLVERDSFWWQDHKPKLLLVNSKVTDNVQLKFAKRTQNGDEHLLVSHNLTGLPARPKGTTRLKLDVKFTTNTTMQVNVTDIGFGELFPITNYGRELAVTC